MTPQRLLAPYLMFVLVTVTPGTPASASEMFSAYTVDNESVRLSEYFEPQKWTLVVFWTTYCKVCARQFPIIESLHQKYYPDRLKVVGIALDGREARATVAAEIARRGVSFDSLVGDSAELANSFERATGEPFSGTPTYLLFDPQGEPAARISGPLQPEAIEHYLQDNPS